MKKLFKLILIGLLTGFVMGSSCDEQEEECPEVAYYGPQPCETDEDCQDEYGANWYCDKDNWMGDEKCGTNWPVCVEDESVADGGVD